MVSLFARHIVLNWLVVRDSRPTCHVHGGTLWLSSLRHNLCFSSLHHHFELESGYTTRSRLHRLVIVRFFMIWLLFWLAHDTHKVCLLLQLWLILLSHSATILHLHSVRRHYAHIWIFTLACLLHVIFILDLHLDGDLCQLRLEI